MEGVGNVGEEWGSVLGCGGSVGNVGKYGGGVGGWFERVYRVSVEIVGKWGKVCVDMWESVGEVHTLFCASPHIFHFHPTPLPHTHPTPLPDTNLTNLYTFSQTLAHFPTPFLTYPTPLPHTHSSYFLTTPTPPPTLPHTPHTLSFTSYQNFSLFSSIAKLV